MLICWHMAAFLLQELRWIVAAEGVWHTGPERFTLWPFTEEVWWSPSCEFAIRVKIWWERGLSVLRVRGGKYCFLNTSGYKYGFIKWVRLESGLQGWVALNKILSNKGIAFSGNRQSVTFEDVRRIRQWWETTWEQMSFSHPRVHPPAPPGSRAWAEAWRSLPSSCT